MSLKRQCAFLSLIGLWIWLQPAGFAQTAAGSIKGTLHASDDSPIAGAIITANVELPRTKANALNFAVATGPTRAVYTTAKDGSFELDRLPAGDYTLCAQAPAAVHLDPCHWGQRPPSVTLAAGQNITGYKLTLAKGALLQVRLDDPKGLLNTPASASGKPHVLMGVSSPSGQFYSLFFSSADTTGRNHSLTVPLNTNLKFNVYSKNVSLIDGNGKAIDPAGSSIPVRFDSTASNIQPLLFHVTAVH